MRKVIGLGLVFVSACADDVDVSPVGDWTLRLDAGDLAECRDSYRDLAIAFEIVEGGEGFSAATKPSATSEPWPADVVEVHGSVTDVIFTFEADEWAIRLAPAEPTARVTWTMLEDGCTVSGVEATITKSPEEVE